MRRAFPAIQAALLWALLAPAPAAGAPPELQVHGVFCPAPGGSAATSALGFGLAAAGVLGLARQRAARRA